MQAAPKSPPALPLALAAAAGLLAFSAFPPLDIGALAWLAIALLFYAIGLCTSPRRAAATAATFAATFYGPLLFYLTRFGIIPWLLVVLLESIFLAAFGALAVNLFKCVLASAALLLTLALSSRLHWLYDAPRAELGWLILSSLTGIVIGDSALFAAVKRLGGHSTLLLQTFAPVFAVSLAVLLGERLHPAQWAGAAVILSGVLLVVVSRRNGDAGGALSLAGVAFALLAALGQGVGLVLAKMGMVTVPAVPATLIRLGSAAAGMFVLLSVSGGLPGFGKLLGSVPTLKRVIPASLIGTYVAMMLMMLGASLTPASLAAVLLSMPPVFSLVVEAVVDRRRPGLGALAGTALSMIGVAVLSTAG